MFLTVFPSRNAPDMLLRLRSATNKVTEFFRKYFTYTLISTSTPLGNSSFIKASIVLDEEL